MRLSPIDPWDWENIVSLLTLVLAASSLAAHVLLTMGFRPF